MPVSSSKQNKFMLFKPCGDNEKGNEKLKRFDLTKTINFS